MKRLIVILMLLVALFAVTGAQAQDTLGYNDPVTGEMTVEEYEFTYVFTAKEGDVVIIEVNPVEILGDLDDPIIILTDPSGSVVADTTDSFSFGRALVAVELSEGGDYTVTVTRADGAEGESVGEFTLEVIRAEQLVFGEVVTGSTDSDSRDQYYYVNADQEFGIAYRRTDGDFSPELKVSVFRSRDFGLDDAAVAYGSEMEGAVLISFDAGKTYIVSLGEALFDFNFRTVTADYELTLITVDE
jgi:hypothetical protein